MLCNVRTDLLLLEKVKRTPFSRPLNKNNDYMTLLKE